MAGLLLGLESHELPVVFKEVHLLLINLHNDLINVRVDGFFELFQQFMSLIVNVERKVDLIRA
jgi:uncharacterized protein with von Willebrand factor type A (vWA) domain